MLAVAWGRPMRLRTRMAIISASAVALVLVIAVVVAQAVARKELIDEIDASLLRRAGDVGEVVELIIRGERPRDVMMGRGAFRRFGPEEFLGRGETGFDALFFQLVLPDGSRIALPDQPVGLPVSDVDVDLAGSPGRPVIRTVGEGEERMRMITSSLPRGVGAVQLARSLEEVDATLEGVTRTMTLAGGIGVLLAAAVGLVVARSALRPVDRLTETVEHVAQTRELAARIAVERDDEVGRLAQSFNAMLEALERSRTQQQQLVRDAGHELRTPLTALRTNIELLAKATTLSDEERAELLEAASYELRALTDLTAELVDLAADSSAVGEAPQRVRLDELVDRVAARFRRRTGRRIDVIATATSADVSVSALERAVGNLIDNADKWSPEGAPVEVHLQGGRLAVADRGSGIAPEDAERVFDRFYRADAARPTPGSGLGLAIVRKIAEEHGGRVFIDGRNEYGGATVGFWLPVEEL